MLYGQFKLDESLIKLQPFKKMYSTKPVVSKPKVSKSPSLKSMLLEIGKGILSLQLMRYLGVKPQGGTQVTQPTMITRQASTISQIPQAPVSGRKVNLRMLFIFGGIALTALAIILFRRQQ